MPKDSRYKVVKILIESGEIKTFQDLFNYIPKRVIYQDLGVNYAKFQRIYKKPVLLSLQELLRLSALIGCEPVKLFEITINVKAAPKKKSINKKP